MKISLMVFVRVDMVVQENKIKTNRWKKRRYYMDRQYFTAKQNRWDRAIRQAEQQKNIQLEERKKSKEFRKNNNKKG